VADITGKTRLAGASINLIYVSMVLHGFSADETDGFVNEVGRLLNPEGRLAVIEFNKKETAFGPPLAIRFSPEDLKQRIGLPPGAFVSLNSYIYMQIFYASASNKG